MQGFFDSILEEEKKEQEGQKEEIKNVEKVEDVEEFDFGNFVNQTPVNNNVEEVKQTEIKQETPKVEQKVENNTRQTTQTSNNSSQINPTLNFNNNASQFKGNEIKNENKGNNQNEEKREIAITNDKNTQLIEKTLNAIEQLTELSNEQFSDEAKTLACEIITSLDHTIRERGLKWNEIDAQGSGLIMQIKKWAKLGVSYTDDKLYPDIRKNNSTKKNDVKIKGQYQTVEKLMIKFCRKNIIKFKTEVMCIGDELKTDFNYVNGEEKIISFNKNTQIDRNKLNNIIGAFKIAYYENEKGEIHQIVTIIEKDRIMRAYNSASTKNVWNTDTQKMVKKTVTWEMFNGEDIRPFMNYPVEIIEDLKIVNENEDVDFNKEHKYKDVVEAQENNTDSIGTGEVVGFEE